LIDGFPDLSGVYSILDDAAVRYSNLGTPPDDQLSKIDATLTDLEITMAIVLESTISNIDDTIKDVQDALNKARKDSIEEMDEFEREKRNWKVDHFTDNPEDSGFALLSDDVNRKLYIVGAAAPSGLLSIWHL